MENKKTLVEKIRKKIKSINPKKVQAEINHLESIMPNLASGYNPHKVSLNNSNYIAYDAKIINKGLNQSGRGDYRYLCQNGVIAGIAIHRENGNGYRRIA